MEFVSAVQDLVQSSPHPSKRLAYGTAGFRDKAENMPTAVTRVGLFSCLVSHWSNSQCLGIMITASHNTEEDNGAKIADIDGGMLEQSWEKHVEELANCEDSIDTMKLLQELIAKHNIPLSNAAHVIIGRDTRPSSFGLFECACRGIEAYGGTVHDIGTVTTPQLHFVVKRLNEEMARNPTGFPNAVHALSSYYSTMCQGYYDLRGTADGNHNDSIIIDAANGIGGRSVAMLANIMQGLYPDALEINIRNDVGDGPVNEGCGAELVQKGQIPPVNVSEDDLNQCICSYDGDADRIVFHSFSDMGGSTKTQWYLADGDKIAALFALLLKEEFVAAGILEEDGSPNESGIRFGAVQTAYANGSSTHFLHEKKIPVVFAKTGVKYLHRKAEESFDVGIYFEANGHGTVIFAEKFATLVAGWGINSDMVEGVSPRAAMARIRITVGSSKHIYCFLLLQTILTPVYS
jgi:phosphoacetylglucosamine mutase